MIFRHGLVPRVAFALLILAGAASALASGEERVLVENGFISIAVNNTGDGRGRFSVDVTGGDPERPDDNSQPLIYGHPLPWTSFSTIRLNGLEFVYGGPSGRRSGRGMAVGEMLEAPHAKDGMIISSWRYGQVEVVQNLSITEGPTTGKPDTARIAYTFINRGETAHRVGLRICLDTMLGSNDGAPFRIGNRQIMTDLALDRPGIQPYWQAFDSLGDPNVIAQGTLDGGELTPPDHLVFTNWGSLADTAWMPEIEDGRDFTRLGEFEPDSAVALLWDEIILPPGGVLTRVTYYGLGGLTIAEGDLTLGITAPSSARSGDGSPFLILAYLENRGEGIANDVVLSVNLADGMRLLNSGEVALGRLKPGESRQVAWAVQGLGAGMRTIEVVAEGLGLEPTVARREIRLLAPPRLKVVALDPPMVQIRSGGYEPYPVPVQAIVSNDGGDTATGTRIELAPGNGLELAPGEGKERYIGALAPGEEALVRWSVVSGGIPGPASYTVSAASIECPAMSSKNAIHWPVLPKQLRVAIHEISASGRYRVDLLVQNVPEMARFSIRVAIPDKFRIEAIQRGGALVSDAKVQNWSSPPVLMNGSVLLSASRTGPLGRQSDRIASIWLIGTGSFETNVSVPEFLDAAGRPIPVSIVYE